MMYLSTEATNKDQSLKMKVLLLTDDKATLDTELIWEKSGFFGDQKGKLSWEHSYLHKPGVNFDP